MSKTQINSVNKERKRTGSEGILSTENDNKIYRTKEKKTRGRKIGEVHRFVRFTSITSNLNLSQQSERDL